MRLLILVCTTLIFALGLMMVFNTSSADILDKKSAKITHSQMSIHTSHLKNGRFGLRWIMHHAFLHQIAYALAGGVAAILISRIGYQSCLKLAPSLLLVATVLLILVFVPGIGKVCNGAHRWVGLGGFTFQPSELVKYLLPMTYIDWVVSRYDAEISFFTFLKRVSLLSLPMFLVLIEPDNGSTAVIGASLIPLFFLSGVRFKFWALPILILVAIGIFAAFQLPYVRGRIEVYLHPEIDLKGKGHQPYQAKIAAGSGGFLGRGPGASLQKLTYLPEAQNDYIAAIYAEEFGFLGILLLITLYMLLAYGGFSIAMRSDSREGRDLAVLITFLITLQAFLNLGVVSGLLPSKGVNLPFFSQGGTSLVANIVGLAMLLNIGQLAHEKKNYIERGGNRRPSFSSSEFS